MEGFSSRFIDNMPTIDEVVESYRAIGPYGGVSAIDSERTKAMKTFSAELASLTPEEQASVWAQINKPLNESGGK